MRINRVAADITEASLTHRTDANYSLDFRRRTHGLGVPQAIAQDPEKP